MLNKLVFIYDKINLLRMIYSISSLNQNFAHPSSVSWNPLLLMLKKYELFTKEKSLKEELDFALDCQESFWICFGFLSFGGEKRKQC